MFNATILVILRVLLDDLASAVYTDDSLHKLLTASALQVCQELDLDTTYTVDFSLYSVSPDPAASATRDDSFVNLLTLKAACMNDRAKAGTAAKQSIRVKDGTSEIDLGGIAAARIALLKMGGNCEAYNIAKFEYQNNLLSSVGSVVMTPFRLYAYEYINSYNDMV